MIPPESTSQTVETMKSIKAIREANAKRETLIRGGDFSQEALDQAKGTAEHVVVGIGYEGTYRCYVDLDAANILERFADHGDIADYDVKIIAFNNDFIADNIGEEI